jgi:prepilin-type N-terminal cleavage/methylation domain-containing protein
MKLPRYKCLSEIAGYSLVEMMMTLAIGLILVSVALPTMIGAIQGYRLNSVSQQTANLIDLARYTAIRRNMVVRLLQAPPQNGNTVLYVDLNGNTTLDGNEPMVMIPSDMQISNGQTGTPDATSMHIGSTIDFTTQIGFDSRGVVNYPHGVGPGAYFLAIAYTKQLQYGVRAVTVTPMGQTKAWKALSGSTWIGM